MKTEKKKMNFSLKIWSHLVLLTKLDQEFANSMCDTGNVLKNKCRQGCDPFDLCLDKLLIENIHQVLSTRQHCSNILFTDGHTKLLDVVLALRDMPQFVYPELLLYGLNTFFHLTVIFYKLITYQGCIDPRIKHLQLVDECLRLSGGVTMKNAHGFTHLAFCCGHNDVVERMLQSHHPSGNPIDPR